MSQLPVTPLLDVVGLVKRFPVKGTRGRMITAVDDVSFSVMPGRTLGLVGESGCGKSTVARILAGIETPDEGSVTILDTDTHKAGASPLGTTGRRRWARAVQMVFQDPMGSLNPRMTIDQILSEPLEILQLTPTRSERRDRIVSLLSLVGLDRELLSRHPHALSGGQRQRVAIARALAVNPRLLLADEAIAALDVSVAAQIVNLIARLQRQLALTLVFISHDLRMVRHVADDVAVMHRGRIVERGATAQVFTSPTHDYTRTLLASAPQLPVQD